MKKVIVSCLVLFALAGIISAITQNHWRDQEPTQQAPTPVASQERILIDIAATAGLAQVTKTWSAEVADFNNDQRPDILLVRHNAEPETLFLNAGDQFTAQAVGRPADRHHCAAADVNLDGRMDAYCSVGAARGTAAGSNNLYLQRSDGAFDDAATDYGVTDPFGRGRWVAFLNANGDAYPDLFVGNRSQRDDGIVSSNQLYVNDKGSTFIDGQSFGITLPIGARCAVVTDFNSDGLDDLLVCSEQGLKLYINHEGTRFEDASDHINAGMHWRRALLVDVNGDAAPDLITLRGDRMAVHFRIGDRFPKLNYTVDLTRGVDIAAADVDGDGDQDLYVVHTGCSDPAGTAAMTRVDEREDFLLRNDGQGQFTRISTAYLRPAQGCGGGVVPIDYDLDGRDELLILNGYARSTGPLQLLQFQRE